MEGPVDREECVYMAKLAEQAERYDEMVSMLVWGGTHQGFMP